LFAGGGFYFEVLAMSAFSSSRARVHRYEWILYVLIAFFGGLLTFAGARAEQKATDDATFRKLIDSYCAAWSSGNPDNAAKFYAKDSNLIFYDLAPFSYTGWKEYSEGTHDLFSANVDSISLTADKDLKTVRRGNIAWTTVSMHALAKMKNGTTIDTPVRYTGIWEKRGKTWVLVHEHLSAPLAG
jgi:ketosteroid isomerase-like protein